MSNLKEIEVWVNGILLLDQNDLIAHVAKLISLNKDAKDTTVLNRIKEVFCEYMDHWSYSIQESIFLGNRNGYIKYAAHFPPQIVFFKQNKNIIELFLNHFKNNFPISLYAKYNSFKNLLEIFETKYESSKK